MTKMIFWYETQACSEHPASCVLLPTVRVISLFALTVRRTYSVSFPVLRPAGLFISVYLGVMFEIILIAPTELQSVPPDLAQTQLGAEHQSAINLTLRKTCAACHLRLLKLNCAHAV